MSRHVTGLYRVRGADTRSNDVRISVGSRSFYVTEAEYRQRECVPRFEDLPWQVPHAQSLTRKEAPNALDPRHHNFRSSVYARRS
jgi:hypothetical protein